jgi:GxxExxY protein
MQELLYKEEIYQLVGFCLEIHRELGKGHDEIIYKDAFVVELSRAGIPFSREKDYEISYKGVILSHFYYADFVVWDKILLEAKAVESLTDSHVKLLNYLAASKLRLGLLVNFSGDSLEWKRVVYDTTSQDCFKVAKLAPENADQLVSIRGIRVSFLCYGIDFRRALRETWLR